jgi:hypothetical protein
LKVRIVTATAIALALALVTPMLIRGLRQEPGLGLSAPVAVAPAQDPEPPVRNPEPPAPPAPPQPVTTKPNGFDTPVPTPRVLQGLAKIENAWQDELDGVRVQVFAGCIPDDQTQGAVWVLEYPQGGAKLHAYKTPEPAGCVRIVAADGTLLTLKATTGRDFRFDVATQEFQA